MAMQQGGSGRVMSEINVTPMVDVEAKTIYTNNPPCGAMRG